MSSIGSIAGMRNSVAPSAPSSSRMIALIF